MSHKARSVLWYAALLPGVLLVLQLSSLLSANLGHSLWLSCQVHDKARPSRYRLAEEFFRVALWLNPRNASARTGQGYLSLSAHRDAEALDFFLAAIRSGEADPFVYSAALRLLYQQGEIDRALSLLGSSPPPQMSVELADYISLLQLCQGDNADWDQVLSLRPADLYAHYRLLERALAARDDAGAGVHRQALQRFPQSALYPRSLELAEFEWAFLPTLYARGLWSSELTARVLSNLAWQRPSSMALEDALNSLVRDYPLEPQWLSILGRLHERRGQWDLAVEAYRRALQIDSAQDLVRLRLALSLVRRAETPQSLGSDLQDAYGLLTAYHRAYSQDIHALRALLSLSQQLDSAQAGALQRDLNALVDPRRYAAASLSRPVESLALGPNLLANAGFESWPAAGDPEGWESLDVSRFEYAGPALFVSGLETAALEGLYSARIDTLWLGQTEGKSRPRAGFWAINPTLNKIADFTLEPGVPYIATIEYQAEGSGVSLSFGNDSRISPAGEQVFPPTAGQVRVASVVLRASAEVHSTLLIRQTGEGALTLDNVSLRKIIVTEPRGP